MVIYIGLTKNIKIPCCKSRLNLKNDEIVKGPSEHNHTISNLEIERRVCIDKMKIQDNPH